MLAPETLTRFLRSIGRMAEADGLSLLKAKSTPTKSAERQARDQGSSKASDEALKKGLIGSFNYFELGKPIELDGILNGKNLPSLRSWPASTRQPARNDEKVDEKKFCIGSTKSTTSTSYISPGGVPRARPSLAARRSVPRTENADLSSPNQIPRPGPTRGFHIDFAQLFEIYRLRIGDGTQEYQQKSLPR